MNIDVNPCNDFYEFSCGGFKQSTDIHDTGNGIDNFEIIKMKIWNQAKKSLEKKDLPGEYKYVKFAKNLYKSCIQPSKLYQLAEIFDKLGGLPIIEGNKWNSTNFFWPNLSQSMHETGFFGDFFQIEIGGDIKNNTRKIIHLNTPQIFANSNEGTYDIFYSRCVKIIFDLTQNVQVNWTSVEEDIYNLFDLMDNLDGIIDRSDHYYNPMTVSELNEIYPFISWKEYLNEILKPSKIQIDDNEVINIQNPSYLGNLSELLNKTRPRTQANFMLWRHVIDSLNYMQGDKQNSWTQCIDLVVKKFSKGLIFLYQRDYYNYEVKNGVEQLTNAIYNEFISTLVNHNWNNQLMKNTTINSAISIIIRLSYSENPSNYSELDKGYKNLKIVSDNFLQNMLRINIHERKSSFEKFKEPIVKNISKSNVYHDLGSFPKYNNEANTISE